MRAAAAFALVAALTLAGSAASQSESHAYSTAGDCGGFAKVAIDMTPGMCAGLVLGPPQGQPFARRQVKMPRSLLPLSDREWIITDLGAWVPRQGAVWKLTAEPGKAPVLVRLFSGLDMPHGLGKGPDGQVYVGEMGRIFRFDPKAADPAATRQVVVDGLPDNRLHENRHPLSSFVFDGDGALLVNIGAASDQCLPEKGPRPARCAEAEGPDAGAVVRRYAYLGQGRWSHAHTVFASGLRNSLALARSPAGVILQAENSIDVEDDATPFEEFNVLKAGKHYGWPYCVELATVAPGWTDQTALDCGGPAHEQPAVLIAPHAAPLSLAYYDGAMFPKLKGRVLVALHGYRAGGARIAAYAVDPAGVPLPTQKAQYPLYTRTGVTWRSYPAAAAGRAAGPLVVTRDWQAKRGKRPRGWPAGVAVAPDGSIWVTDDRNAVILRFASAD